MDTQEARIIEGRVEAVLVGERGPTSVVQSKIQLHVGHGVKGDRHAGGRLADVREKALLAHGLFKGMPVANVRELTVLSVEEQADVATKLGLPRVIPHGTLGENLVLSGVPRLSSLPAGTLLFFRKGKDTIRTAVVVVWGENVPCTVSGQSLQEVFPDVPDVQNRFVKAAMHGRGLVGFVYSAGFICEGDIVIARVPPQRIYAS